MKRVARPSWAIARLGCARTASRASRGQVIIMFAVLASALIGMLGLSIDGGMYFYARRSAQAAADAGAMAGARQVAKWATSNKVSAEAEVNQLVADNRFGNATIAVESCKYIGTDGRDLTESCSVEVPSAAAGVHVRTRVLIPTFFIRVLPGAPTTSTAYGDAKAMVQRAKGLVTDAPFIACGASGWDVTDEPTTKNGGTMRPVLDTNNQIRHDAINRIYRIWDSNLEGTSDCREGSQFKGLSAQLSDEIDNTVPTDLTFKSGFEAGPTLSAVNGPGGCGEDVSNGNGCVMILPIGANDPDGKGNDKQIRVVAFGAYLMSEVPGNTKGFNGKLLSGYTLSGEGESGWSRGDSSPIVIRMVP
jgi:Flp pilus assembly protein TadG